MICYSIIEFVRVNLLKTEMNLPHSRQRAEVAYHGLLAMRKGQWKSRELGYR